ncbi:MAG: hypothetical protein ACYCSW_09520 [bacterium]
MQTLKIKKTQKKYNLTCDFFEIIKDQIEDFTNECKALKDAQNDGDEIEMLKRLQALRSSLLALNINSIECNLNRLTAKIFKNLIK